MAGIRSLVAAAFAAALLAPAAAQAATRDVLFVGNNWDGTADVVDPVNFTRIARINIIPDKDERMAEILADPVRTAYFLGIRAAVGEGHDQFVDDMFSSPDGRHVYVSRPSFADVVGIDLATGRIAWRVPVEGQRSDHMGISPDGTRLLVSASTARKVHIIDPREGKLLGSFDSGDTPHENNYSADGRTVFHASIGLVYTPLDRPAFDSTKGDRWFQVVDAASGRILKRWDMGRKLEEAGHSDMSAAVRPMALSPDEQTVFFQVSFFHGFVEFDLVGERVVRLAHLPLSEEAQRTPRENYLLDSAHHGLSINPEGTKLCAAGTMSDYAAIVRRDTFATTISAHGKKPYWSTNSGDGRFCFVSFSGDDRVGVIDYASEREVASIPVGDHPQRMRMGKVRTDDLASPNTAFRGRRPRLFVSVRPRRVRAKRPASVRVLVTRRRGGTATPVQGARVFLAGVRATTDGQGRAVLRKRRGFDRARTYRVRASLPGYRAGTARVRSLPRRR